MSYKKSEFRNVCRSVLRIHIHICTIREIKVYERFTSLRRVLFVVGWVKLNIPVYKQLSLGHCTLHYSVMLCSMWHKVN